MARKNKTKRTAVRPNHDLGTPETRRRLTPDPLLSSNLETHRAQAALAIREALEDGLGARGLDIVRIGMGGGASNGERDYVPTTPRNLACLEKWRLACKASDLEHYIVELFAIGHSLRQIAAHVRLRRTRCADIVDEGLDLYADLRGYRRHPRQTSGIAVWEAPAAGNNPDPEQVIFQPPPKAALRNRAIRNDNKTREHHEH